MKKKLLQGLLALLFLIVFAALAAYLTHFLVAENFFPTGSDTYYHLYRADTLYHSILEGDYYPLYDRYWYNGVENMRFWPPIAAYLIAGCIALVGGDVYVGFALFVSVIFFFGALAWLVIGLYEDRVIFSAFLGVLWFFMPNNLFALFVEGNLPRCIIMVFLPLLLYHTFRFLKTKSVLSVGLIMLYFTIILLCHVGYGGMIALSLLVFLLVYQIAIRKRTGALSVIMAYVIPFLVVGLWIYPSLVGANASTTSTELMRTFFQKAVISLNPFLRLTAFDKFYFGLAAFVLGIFGIVCAKKEAQTLFWSGILIFFFTTDLMFPVLSRLPGSSYLWMLRFISIALCFILLGLLFWKSLRAPFLLLVCALLVLDCVPSLKLLYMEDQSEAPADRLKEQAERIMLDKAKDMTVQRLAVLDNSTEGSAIHFYTANVDTPVEDSFGAGWTSAATAKNIVMLNEAVSEQGYLYLFDRLVELGDDTVLVQIGQLKGGEEDIGELTYCAERSGYSLVDQNEYYLLYHFTPVNRYFGTINTYQAIGIGTSTSEMELFYPVMEEGESDNLDDYTFDDLKDYQAIYLDHFEYDDIDTAEALVKELADHGVRIIINADGIPVNGISKVQEFLGVNCSRILFENGYPFLFVDGEKYDLDFFEEGYEEWDTVFLNQLDQIDGYFLDNNLEESFLGTVYNDNITIIGINLIYHYQLTGDPYAWKIISNVFQLDPAELPIRQIVPISVSHVRDKITIDSAYDEVNTTIAYHDMFEASQPIESHSHLVQVNKGKTEITLHYPYFKQGMALSLVGLLLVITHLVIVQLRYAEDRKERKNA